MQPLIEESKQCFNRLMKENANKKFLAALSKVKTACDRIEAVKGEMNFTSVATLSEVALSTIKNAKDTHRAYVRLRIKEYEPKVNREALIPTAKKDNSDYKKQQRPKYPASDLDQKTMDFIDAMWIDIANLEARNRFQENASALIQKEVLNVTRANPLDERKMIRSGADDEGSMALIKSDHGRVPSKPITSELQSALQNILKIHIEVGNPLKLEKSGALIMETLSTKKVVLLPKERRAIMEAIDEDGQDG